MFRIIAGLLTALLALIGLGWLGTRWKVESFPIPARHSREMGSIAPPADLPPPVTRYVQAVFGDRIPVVQSALISGTARLRINGLVLPARFRFYYEAGHAYYHYIQTTWFGLPLLTVNERYQHGAAVLDLPGNRIENNAQTNAAGNLGLWAEGIWMPSIWFTDERVRWEPVDEHTARLIVPDAAPEETFTVRFDPHTGLLSDITTLRYQDPASAQRTRWINRALEWRTVNGVKIPWRAETQWDDAPPWATWHIDAILYNVDVAGRLAQFGGDYTD